MQIRPSAAMSDSPNSLSKSHLSQRAVHVAMFAVALAACAGCGDGRRELIPVSGRVLIDGKPVEHGYIRVFPEDYRPASGSLGPGGKFVLTTFESGDGCVAGRHRIAVNALEVIDSRSQRWHAPKSYRNAQTSNLSMDVSADGAESTVVELTWSGGKPFVESFKSSGD